MNQIENEYEMRPLQEMIFNTHGHISFLMTHFFPTNRSGTRFPDGIDKVFMCKVVLTVAPYLCLRAGDEVHALFDGWSPVRALRLRRAR